MNQLTAQRVFKGSELAVSLYLTRSSNSLGFHSHEFSEIAIMFEGTARYSTDYGSELIGPGDVLVIPPRDVHKYSDEKNVLLMNMLFQLDKLPVPYHEVIRYPAFSMIFMKDSGYFRELHYYPKLHLEPEELEHVRRLLTPAYEAQQAGGPACNLSVFGAFLQLIPILMNSYAALTRNRMDNTPGRLLECLNYIAKNYRSPLTVEKLAKISCMSKTSFFRHFRAVTGHPPLNYITLLRLRDAADMLVNTSMTVSDIALGTGFEDSNYFSRIFTKYMKRSPLRFRTDSIRNE